MSVAFRRESDEEHKEPRFELPLPPGPNVVTQRGHDLIQARTEELEALVGSEPNDEKRVELQRDLRYWRARLATAQIAPLPSGTSVAIGTKVTIEQAGRTRTLTIVGHDEADPASGLLAFASPLGHALLGAEPGDDVDPPGNAGPLTILSVEIASFG
ncbi:MAG: GreA/GreB family elongation factor [Sphingomicrobium sp.]